MTIYFYEPPPRQKLGGLDLAVRSLERYLTNNNVTVKNCIDFGVDRTKSDKVGLNRTNPSTLVHFHGLGQPGFLKSSRRCRNAKIPYLVSPHGMLEPWAWNQKRWKKWPYFLLFERRHLKGAARLLATSELEANNVRRFFPEVPCPVIPLGLPEQHRPDYAAARSRLGWEPAEKILLFLSRIHPKKGLELLLKALAATPARDSLNVRLVIIGEGEPAYVRRLQASVEALKDNLPRVNWLGPIWGEQKWSYLQGADLFCLPSFSENFGLAVLEALQVGARVLTTNTGPWEFLREWNAGFVVDPTVEGVRQGLAAFLAEPGWSDTARFRLADRVRQRFGWETIGPEYLQLYQSLLQKVA